MLYHLRVKNLALIDSAEVEFGDGLNILTGETGAGKSIIIGSVQIALGGKAPKEMIRRGCDSAYIELFYDSKTILQEIVQGHTDETLTYVLLKEEGPDHNKSFEVSAMLDGQEIGRGIGRTKKSAEQRAAYRGILTIRKPQE